MPLVALSNAQVVPSSGDQGPGVVSCTEDEATAFTAAGYGTRVAEDTGQ